MQVCVEINGDIRIPASVARQLGLKPGDLVDITAEDGRIFIAPAKSSDPTAIPDKIS